MVNDRRVWVFNGDGARLPSAVFASRESAERWIADNSLSGMLTAYPLDTSAYDWAIEKGYFTPKKPIRAEFIAGFTSAYQEHYHYVRGVHERTAEDTSNRLQDDSGSA